MRALEPDDRPVTISLCLNRFVPESARNRLGTNKRLSLCWLAVRARTHTEPPNATWGGGGGGVGGAQCPTDISHTVRALPAFYNRIAIVCLFVLRFYGPVNPMESCRTRLVYLATRLLGGLVL